jgi:DNA-binding NarL/FixJ family response regulator
VGLDEFPIRVLVVDDYEVWRSFVSAELAKQTELELIGQVSDGSEAVQQAQQLRPELILLDIGLPTLNGIEVAHRIRESHACKILFLSENRSADVVEEALRTGARGYVVKSEANRELLPAIKAVLSGETFVSSSLSMHIDLGSGNRSSVSHRIENNPYLLLRSSESISEFLASIIDATDADFGNVQLFDSTNQVLRIVAHRGFESEFLDYFDTVSCDDDCLCGAAMNARTRIVVSDVSRHPVYSGDSRGVMLRANVRSVQTTPLIDRSGNLSAWCPRITTGQEVICRTCGNRWMI